MFNKKFIVRSLMPLFIILGQSTMPETTFALETPHHYSGILQPGGTHFDEFTTKSGDIFEIDKNNPKIKAIYKYCGYGEQCNIFAHVEDDMITKIISAKKTENDQ